MLITRLELDDFKSYERIELAFQPGTNAILGHNGAGKSTILEAIGYALFDYKPNGVKIAELVREGAKSGRVVVTLISAYDGREYEVEKTVRVRGGTRHRVHDPEIKGVIAEGGQEVGVWLHQHLGIDNQASLDDLFENTIGVPQGTFTAPFLLSPAKRKDTFDPLLQVDEYRRASDGLRATVRDLEDKTTAIANDMARMEGRLESLPGFYAERDRLRTEQETLEGRCQVLADELAAARIEMAALDAARDQAARAVDRAKSLALEVRQGEVRLADARDELSRARAAAQQLEATRPEHDAYLEAEHHLRELAAQQSRRDDLLKRRARLDMARARAETQREQGEQALRGIAQAQERLHELEPLVERQTAAERALAQARQDRATEQLVSRQYQEALAECERSRQRANVCREGLAQAAEWEQRIERAQRAVKEWQHQEQVARESRAADEALAEGLRQQSERLAESIAVKCPVCEAELTPSHRAELLERNGRNLRELEGEMAALDAQAAECRRQGAAERKIMSDAQGRLRHLPTAEALVQAEDALARAQASADLLRAQVDAIGDVASRLRTCEETLNGLGNPRREAERHEDTVARQATVEREHEEVLARLREIAKELAPLEQALAAFGRLDEQIKTARAQRERHLAGHNAFLASEEQAARCADLSTRVTAQEGALAAKRELQSQAETQAEQAAAAYDARHHDEIRRRVDDLAMQHTQATTRLGAGQERLTHLDGDIAQLETVRSQLEALGSQYEELERLSSLAQAIRALLTDAGPLVTRQLVHQISRDASTHYADLMDDATSRLTWSEDYELSIEVKGRSRSYPQFSGGEQMCAALALRLALMNQVSAMDIAFFDEPTAHLDPERREGLADRIMQVKGFSQMFVISHDDTFERAAQSYIRIAKGENGSYQEDD